MKIKDNIKDLLEKVAGLPPYFKAKIIVFWHVADDNRRLEILELIKPLIKKEEDSKTRQQVLKEYLDKIELFSKTEVKEAMKNYEKRMSLDDKNSAQNVLKEIDNL